MELLCQIAILSYQRTPPAADVREMLVRASSQRHRRLKSSALGGSRPERDAPRPHGSEKRLGRV
jgi:hypothetical protein